MLSDKDELFQKFAQAGQSHVFNFYNELNDDEKATLLASLRSIDPAKVTGIWNQVFSANFSSSNDRVFCSEVFSPPYSVNWLDVNTPSPAIHVNAAAIITPLSGVADHVVHDWKLSCYDAMYNGKIGVLLMAGGEGSRLGYHGPKGCMPVGPISRKSLFQLFFERIRRLKNIVWRHNSATNPDNASAYHLELPIYIMAGENNIEAITRFLEENGNFGIPTSQVMCFQQPMLPSFDYNGKFILQSKCKLATSPNGNGGLFHALCERNHIYADMQKRQLLGLHVVGIDNILCKVADPVFLGYCITTNAIIGNKCVTKLDPEEKIGIFCSKIDESSRLNCTESQASGTYNMLVPCTVEYTELPKDLKHKLANSSNDGISNGSVGSHDKLLYNCGSIANHYFSLSFVAKLIEEIKDCNNSSLSSMYHVAHKKIPCVDISSGNNIVPEENNGVKLETFIFDCFRQCPRVMGLLVDREDEFSPIKNPTGQPDSLFTAQRDLSRLHYKWITRSQGSSDSAKVDENAHTTNFCELSPLVSYSGENLFGRFNNGVDGSAVKLPFRLDTVLDERD